jgi:NAD(P)H-dependent flavin oxidoreductase YrpB (nitropropane dioxygenase family)
VLRTAFTDLVGCRVPIQLAAMGGGVTTPELAIAVCRAGGLGMLQASGPTPLADRLAAMEAAGARPVGVNFVVHRESRVDPAQVEEVASRVRVVEFFYGDPDPAWVERAHGAGALASWQVGSVAEAVRAADAGCDLIVAQGEEAGGHVRGTTALLPLLAGVLDAVTVPVVAAGGIASARSMAAALAAGASGVRVGTRFLATKESGAHPEYVRALVAASGDPTVLTTEFAVGWPADSPHRVLRSALERARASGEEVVAEVDTAGETRPVPRLAALTPSRYVRGDVAAMAMYAGQGVGLVRDVPPAAEVVASLAGGAERLLRAWGEEPAARDPGRP